MIIIKNCIKIVIFSWLFTINFEDFSGVRGISSPTPYEATPLISTTLVDLDSHRKFSAGATGFVSFFITYGEKIVKIVYYFLKVWSE